MNIEKFRETIARRIYVEEISQGEWADGIEECWKMEIEILSEDIPSTIEFLETECTADEYSWISEVLDDIVDKNPSSELVECYKSLMNKFPEECIKYNIAGVVEICENIIKWENDNGKK
ncbi:MAG: hypothetical protein MJ130_07775 [Lachnospiraceae bacterium]|nr:hypothetical protein [Lachnospiraceae bacterium]